MGEGSQETLSKGMLISSVDISGWSLFGMTTMWSRVRMADGFGFHLYLDDLSTTENGKEKKWWQPWTKHPSSKLGLLTAAWSMALQDSEKQGPTRFQGSLKQVHSLGHACHLRQQGCGEEAGRGLTPSAP